jgi:pullulanase/glycogen debranching enzyme
VLPRGANDFYYILQKDTSRYADHTSCGNTLNANQPIIRRLIKDSLRYWVTQMHVDLFRFDFAENSRDESDNNLSWKCGAEGTASTPRWRLPMTSALGRLRPR